MNADTQDSWNRKCFDPENPHFKLTMRITDGIKVRIVMNGHPAQFIGWCTRCENWVGDGNLTDVTDDITVHDIKVHGSEQRRDDWIADNDPEWGAWVGSDFPAWPHWTEEN